MLIICKKKPRWRYRAWWPAGAKAIDVLRLAHHEALLYTGIPWIIDDTIRPMFE